jgi:hypothetical protein
MSDEYAEAKRIFEAIMRTPRGRLAIMRDAARYLDVALTKGLMVRLWAEKFNMENVPGV